MSFNLAVAALAAGIKVAAPFEVYIRPKWFAGWYSQTELVNGPARYGELLQAVAAARLLLPVEGSARVVDAAGVTVYQVGTALSEVPAAVLAWVAAHGGYLGLVAAEQAGGGVVGARSIEAAALALAHPVMATADQVREAGEVREASNVVHVPRPKGPGAVFPKSWKIPGRDT